MKDLGAPFTDDQVAICKVETFPNKKKSSFHVVINNSYIIKDMPSIKNFADFIRSKASMTMFKNVIDCSVYSKNRVFKLPFQTKKIDDGCRPPQKPLNNLHTLDDFLISHNLSDNVVYLSIKTQHQGEKTARISNNQCRGSRTLVVRPAGNILQQFRFNYQGIDISKIPIGEPSRSPEYLVRSIYNDATMPHIVWMGVGSALKKLFLTEPAKGQHLFNEWSRAWLLHPDPETAEKRKEKFERDQIEGWESFRTDRANYQTLKILALECNHHLVELFSKPWSILFDNSFIENLCTSKIINERYICDNFNICQTVNDFRTVFVKSPMGTGKSHAIKNLLKKRTPFESNISNYDRVLYLSSKRAFSAAMTAEFKSQGFINYMDPEAKVSKNKINRLFCSIESLYNIVRLRQDHLFHNLDLLIMDESESLFSVVSSETLKSNSPEKNLECLTKLIEKTPKVVLMDANLSNRSVKPLEMIRGLDKTTSFYLKNEWKPPMRYCRLLTKNVKEKIFDELNKNLIAKKRCVAIIGSKVLADRIVESVKKFHGNNKKVTYYSSDRRLENIVNVKNEWKNTDLLIYTPTITCGINYPKVDFEDGNFDKEFVYCLNTGSSNFRCINQARQRVRYFKDDTLTLGMSIFNGQDRGRFPDNIEEVTESLECLRKISDSNECRSVNDISSLKWTFETMVFNELEKNLNALYIIEIVQEYFRQENIHILRDCSVTDERLIHESLLEIKNDDWKFDEIQLIDSDLYQQHVKSSHNQICFIDLNVRKELAKYEFLARIKNQTPHDVIKKTFDYWFKKKNRIFLRHIFQFKRVLYRRSKSKEDNFVYTQDTDVVEFFQQTRRSFPHIIFMLEKLGPIKNERVNLACTFTTGDLKLLVDTNCGYRYNNFKKKEVNHLIYGNKYYYRDYASEMTSDTLKGILNLILKSFFNYQISTVKKVRKTIKKSKCSEYCIKTKTGTPCIFSILKDDWPDLT